jgi:hypothetical protein
MGVHVFPRLSTSFLSMEWASFKTSFNGMGVPVFRRLFLYATSLRLWDSYPGRGCTSGCNPGLCCDFGLRIADYRIAIRHLAGGPASVCTIACTSDVDVDVEVLELMDGFLAETPAAKAQASLRTPRRLRRSSSQGLVRQWKGRVKRKKTADPNIGFAVFYFKPRRTRNKNLFRVLRVFRG